MIDDRFDLGVRVVCIKEYPNLRVGAAYEIDGCGELPMASQKNGYGFSIKVYQAAFQGQICMGKSILIKMPRDPNDWTSYYFTPEEMEEYFITDIEDYVIYTRDRKINEIIDK